MLVPVILSGGLGTRLWPVSRASYPKQFVNLVDPDRSLLQMAAERIKGLNIEHTGWLVVANNEHRFLIADQLQQIDANVERVILEPVARNTAPAVALAALYALNLHHEPRLLVQTADHMIPDTEYFCGAVKCAYRSGQPMVTFGVQPTRPETGYGYIQVSHLISDSGLSKVAKFVEKPDLATAEQYLEEGGYLWNSGMFLLDAKTYLGELARLKPTILDACKQAVEKSIIDLDFCRVDEGAFSKSPSDSIDYAVMEHAKNVSVLPFESDWSDLGTWDAVLEQLATDENGNAMIGDGLIEDSKNTLIRSERRLVAALGVEDLLIIETPDVVLVSKKQTAQDVKQLVECLRTSDRAEADEHVIGYRPWGTYELIAKGKDFQVKKIIVKPGMSLSLQMHHHRAEHWVVVEGIAEVTNGDQSLVLEANESTYIPKEVNHRLANPGNLNLVLIEIQSGSYLGEDDIIRFDDQFGRISKNIDRVR